MQDGMQDAGFQMKDRMQDAAGSNMGGVGDVGMLQAVLWDAADGMQAGMQDAAGMWGAVGRFMGCRMLQARLWDAAGSGAGCGFCRRDGNAPDRMGMSQVGRGHCLAPRPAVPGTQHSPAQAEPSPPAAVPDPAASGPTQLGLILGSLAIFPLSFSTSHRHRLLRCSTG